MCIRDRYWASRAWRLYAYGLGLLIAVLWVVRMQVEVRLAHWIGRFYDAAQDVLQKKEGDPADSFGALMPSTCCSPRSCSASSRPSTS